MFPALISNSTSEPVFAADITIQDALDYDQFRELGERMIIAAYRKARQQGIKKCQLAVFMHECESG